MKSAAIVIVILSTLLHGLVPSAQAAGKGIQTAPDENLVLISKDVQQTRWAITFDPTTGIATGSTFPLTGTGTPQFVWCSAVSVALDADPTKTTYNLDCFGADACTASPCSAPDWKSLGTVELDGSFFFTVTP
jgi:hypothetical protein